MNSAQPNPAGRPQSKSPESSPPPPPPAKLVTAGGLAVQEDLVDEPVGQKKLMFNVLPSWLVSFIAHMVVIILLAIYMLPGKEETRVALEAGESVAALEDTLDLDFELNLEEDPLETEVVEEPVASISEAIETPVMEANADFGEILGADFSVESEALTELSNFDSTNEVSSRSDAAKEDMLRKYGGSAASEEAVALALKWIIAHQLPDGGWSFDHQRGPGTHRTSLNPGSLADDRNGATAMALLPLLGAGQTHRSGEYKVEIENGLKFLISQAKSSGRGLSYWEEGGSMYSHGLVSIVFNETYAMTSDPVLAPFAQRTIFFIEDAQDPVGGGWRYRPREPGDTSVVGWQLMALKSGYSTGMKINPRTIRLAEKFLDSVSTSGGAFYGYLTRPRNSPADGRTAIGLLCRMYMGWSKEAPGLVDGVSAISKRGPRMRDEIDMYYNYYATQLMKQYGGQPWKDWNSVMRDYLVKTQIKQGDAAGSWDIGRQYGDAKGGRLYATSLSCMTLEVYYRYLPIYAEEATREEFKLD